MGTTTFLPPKTGNFILDEYLAELHSKIFGYGGAGGALDGDNAPGFHSGLIGGHGDIIKADDAGTQVGTSIYVATADADSTYGAEEAALINEIKTDLNYIIDILNGFIDKFNQQQQAFRDAKQI